MRPSREITDVGAHRDRDGRDRAVDGARRRPAAQSRRDPAPAARDRPGRRARRRRPRSRRRSGSARRTPAPRGTSGRRAHDVSGETLADDVVHVAIIGTRHRTLLAFLSSSCLTCREFWDAFGRADELGLPADMRLVVVAKDARDESITALREVAPHGLAVVMSSAAWADYDVPGSPYFVLVDGAAGPRRGRRARARRGRRYATSSCRRAAMRRTGVRPRRRGTRGPDRPRAARARHRARRPAALPRRDAFVNAMVGAGCALACAAAIRSMWSP